MASLTLHVFQEMNGHVKTLDLSRKSDTSVAITVHIDCVTKRAEVAGGHVHIVHMFKLCSALWLLLLFVKPSSACFFAS